MRRVWHGAASEADVGFPPPARKGNTRSPVKQCQDYIAGARRGLFGNEPVLPWWGVVTDMNEFRLYWWDRMPQSFLRFTLATPGMLPDLLTDDRDARFDRFLFARLFHRNQLLSVGGPPSLLRLIARQGESEKALEGGFYQDYKGVRDRLFSELQAHNAHWADRPAALLRLAQKVLDRFIFAFYCEDMGQRLLFPPDLVRDMLREASLDQMFDPEGDDIWRRFVRLFALMDRGGAVRAGPIPAFNGGLFRADPEIDALTIPNAVFCTAGQGVNDASVRAHPRTILHLCGSYNYAARGDARDSIGLYTLGRIFEQSITELDNKEADLEQRPSLTVVARRKLPTRRGQGVYYTPEWVVERIVAGVLDPWFAEARTAAGWRAKRPKHSTNWPALRPASPP